MVDATRRPVDFKALDADHVDRCAKHRRCGICGGRIKHGRPLVFIGPDDGRTCFADPWMHPECADVATAQCPFIAGRRDWRDPSARTNPFTASYSAGMAVYDAMDARSHRDRLGNWHFEAVGEITRRA
jgi:hypothetical protein